MNASRRVRPELLSRWSRPQPRRGNRVILSRADGEESPYFAGGSFVVFAAQDDTFMNILQVVPTYLPARRYGGPIESVHGLCKALVARGHDVTVFTTNVDGD